MSRNVSSTFISATNKQSTDEVFVFLLEFDHSTLAEPLRFSSDTTQTLPVLQELGTVSGGNEYLYAPFGLELPAQEKDGISKATITIENVDRQIIATLRGLTSALDVNMKIVLASDPDTIETEIANFKLRNAEYDKLVVSGDIAVQFFDEEPCPNLRFTPSQFPGIF
jgi:hypothetical protein